MAGVKEALALADSSDPRAPAPTVHEALASVMADIKHVGKDGWNDHQSFSFRGIDAVVNAVGPALRKHGVIVVPRLLSATYDVVQTTTGKASTACRVVVSYVFLGPRGDSIETSVAGEAWDSGDKATPKAMSVAFRTALLQSLALPTDEPDPDASTYERKQSAPDPLNVSKAHVRAAWEHQHELGHLPVFEPDAVRAHYEQMYALPLDDATPEQLNTYADLLEGKAK